MLPPVSIEQLDLWFQVQHAPLYTNLASATQEIFKLLFIHHLMFGLGWFS